MYKVCVNRGDRTILLASFESLEKARRFTSHDYYPEEDDDVCIHANEMYIDNKDTAFPDINVNEVKYLPNDELPF